MTAENVMLVSLVVLFGAWFVKLYRSEMSEPVTSAVTAQSALASVPHIPDDATVVIPVPAYRGRHWQGNKALVSMLRDRMRSIDSNKRYRGIHRGKRQ